MKELNQVQQFIIDNIEGNESTISKLARDKFDISRQAISRHLGILKELGLIRQEGERNKTSYFLANKVQSKSKKPEASKKDLSTLTKKNKKSFEVVVGEEEEDMIWRSMVKNELGPLEENILNICRYGFTEMFNNVIDHSKSKKAIIEIERTEKHLQISIQDFGVGVFKKIAQFFKIQDLRDAVIRLHQGKVTTDNKNHTGQGIFFTSRAFDRFCLSANGFLYIKDNSKEDDWYFESQKDSDFLGTKVIMQISRNSDRIIKKVFDLYTNDEFSFDKSHIRIELGKYDEDFYVSRSQAKRLLAGLANFRTIVLDFKNIKNVGQGFVDEVFGVFGLENPEVRFEVCNANEDILFMVRKGLRDRSIPVESVFIHR